MVKAVAGERNQVYFSIKQLIVLHCVQNFVLCHRDKLTSTYFKILKQIILKNMPITYMEISYCSQPF
jgi:hypothetical protein